jgi:glycosyltransferase involved in cell wall biosynthesis
MNKIDKILVIGNFCEGIKVYGGQSTKARNYAKGLSDRYGKEKIYKIDTYNWKKHPELFVKLITQCLKSDIVVILPNQNGLKAILPICSLCKKIKRFKFLYPVVGGWLPSYTENHKILAQYLKSVDRIYVETKAMLKAMNQLGYSNVELAPVFTYRKGLKEPSIKQEPTVPYKLCTFSRVTAQKGISLAINAIDSLNKKYRCKMFSLDIYGMLDPEYEQELNSLIKDSIYNATLYQGIIDDDAVIETLSKYDAMLFPTYYPGEGFPATVLESMLASTPIIASDWRYNSEIIINEKNGMLFDLNGGYKKLAEVIEKFFSDKTRAVSMRQHCLDIARQYAPEAVMESMFNYIEG